MKWCHRQVTHLWHLVLHVLFHLCWMIYHQTSQSPRLCRACGQPQSLAPTPCRGWLRSAASCAPPFWGHPLNNSQTNVLHYGPLSVCMGHLALLPFSSFMSTLPPKTDHVWKYMGTQLWGDFRDTITGYDSIKQWAYWTECIHHYNSFYSHTSKVGWLEKQKSFIIQQQLLGKKKNPKLEVKQLAL